MDSSPQVLVPSAAFGSASVDTDPLSNEAEQGKVAVPCPALNQQSGRASKAHSQSDSTSKVAAPHPAMHRLCQPD